MKKNPGIKVRIENIPYNEYWSKLLTMMAGGSAPDIIFVESTRIASFIVREQLLDLTSFIKNDPSINLDDFYPLSLKAYTFDNKLYGLPNDIAVLAVFYNKDLFDAASVKYPDKNWTWKDYLEISLKLTKDINKDGIPEQYGTLLSPWWLWIWQNGCDFVDNPYNPKKCTINSPAAREALKFWRDLVHKYKVAPTPITEESEGRYEMFMSGKIGMVIDGHWMVPKFNEITTFRWDVVGLPKGKRKANWNVGSCYSIPKLAKHPEKAWELIKYMAGFEGQKLIVSQGFSTPALKTIANSDVFLNVPYNNKVFIEEISYLYLPPITPKYDEIMDTLERNMQLIKVNKKTVEEVCEICEIQVNKILGEE